jgi:hypothetical protein
MATILTPTGSDATMSSVTAAEATGIAVKRDGSLEPTPEQLRYARLLEKGMRVGLACLLVTFSLYVSGVVAPHTPLERVHECWTLNAQEYHSWAGIEPGWSWVKMLGQGDFLNFIGIVILASVTSFCYLAVIPMMLRRRDTIYAVLAILQVIVLALAASGLFAMGGH